MSSFEASGRGISYLPFGSVGSGFGVRSCTVIASQASYDSYLIAKIASIGRFCYSRPCCRHRHKHQHQQQRSKKVGRLWHYEALLCCTFRDTPTPQEATESEKTAAARNCEEIIAKHVEFVGLG